MKTKKNPKANLEHYSGIFALLGLVLSLFITYGFIEHKTYETNKPDDFVTTTTINYTEPPSLVQFTVIKEKPIRPKIETPVVKEPKGEPITTTDPTKFTKKDNDDVIKEPLITSTDDNSNTADNPTEIISDHDVEEIGPETVHFISIENAPVFPGCEKYIRDKVKSSKCFNKKIVRFFNHNFDTEIAEELNLFGLQKINCNFIINHKGEVSTKIRTSKTHPLIAKEIKRVLKSLPKMKPAKQNGQPVNLIYTLPVRFIIE